MEVGWSSGRTSRATHIGKDSAPFPLGGGFNSHHLHPNLPTQCACVWFSIGTQTLVKHTHTQKTCVCLSEPRFGRANAGAQTQHTHTHTKTCVCLSEPRFWKAGYGQHTYLHPYPQTPTPTQTHPHRYTHTDTESFSSVQQISLSKTRQLTKTDAEHINTQQSSTYADLFFQWTRLDSRLNISRTKAKYHLRPHASSSTKIENYKTNTLSC